MSISNFLKLQNIDPFQITAVAGGDINAACKIETKSGSLYFVKENNAIQYPQMFEKEAAGLISLSLNSKFHVPKVLACSEVDGKQYLLLEWLKKESPATGFWELFGKTLAEMHSVVQPYFGWESNNFIGSLVQINDSHKNWADFFIECRLLPMVTEFVNKAVFTKADDALTQLFCNKVKDIFPYNQPSLLHGDLWKGNFMCTQNKPALYDPAVYYGHREMDIGMTKLFGGFPSRFYESYVYYYPLHIGWEKRVKLAQLYPILVHAGLFGGGYVQEALSIMKLYT